MKWCNSRYRHFARHKSPKIHPRSSCQECNMWFCINFENKRCQHNQEWIRMVPVTLGIEVFEVSTNSENISLYSQPASQQNTSCQDAQNSIHWFAHQLDHGRSGAGTARPLRCRMRGIEFQKAQCCCVLHFDV